MNVERIPLNTSDERPGSADWRQSAVPEVFAAEGREFA